MGVATPGACGPHPASASAIVAATTHGLRDVRDLRGTIEDDEERGPTIESCVQSARCASPLSSAIPRSQGRGQRIKSTRTRKNATTTTTTAMEQPNANAP